MNMRPIQSATSSEPAPGTSAWRGGISAGLNFLSFTNLRKCQRCQRIEHTERVR